MYVNLTDLEGRMRRPLSPSESAPAREAIEDAVAMLDIAYPLPESPSDSLLRVRTSVVCRMVMRAFATPLDAVGMESTQEGAGPFQRTYNFTNPTGDLYLTKQDRDMLAGRTGRARVGSVDLLADHWSQAE